MSGADPAGPGGTAPTWGRPGADRAARVRPHVGARTLHRPRADSSAPRPHHTKPRRRQLSDTLQGTPVCPHSPGAGRGQRPPAPEPAAQGAGGRQGTGTRRQGLSGHVDTRDPPGHRRAQRWGQRPRPPHRAQERGQAVAGGDSCRSAGKGGLVEARGGAGKPGARSGERTGKSLEAASGAALAGRCLPLCPSLRHCREAWEGCLGGGRRGWSTCALPTHWAAAAPSTPETPFLRHVCVAGDQDKSRADGGLPRTRPCPDLVPSHGRSEGAGQRVAGRSTLHAHTRPAHP